MRVRERRRADQDEVDVVASDQAVWIVERRRDAVSRREGFSPVQPRAADRRHLDARNRRERGQDDRTAEAGADQPGAHHSVDELRQLEPVHAREVDVRHGLALRGDERRRLAVVLRCVEALCLEEADPRQLAARRANRPVRLAVDCFLVLDQSLELREVVAIGLVAGACAGALAGVWQATSARKVTANSNRSGAIMIDLPRGQIHRAAALQPWPGGATVRRGRASLRA